MIEIFAVCILGGYFLGSIPFGLVVTRLAGTEDIRKIGSGNIGATNVLRTGRKDLAILTVLLDVSKAGFAAWLAQKNVTDHEVLLLGVMTPVSSLAALVAGTAAIVGHNFPIWLKFKGGKGVASSFGLLLVMAPEVAVFAFGVWILFAVVFRYSSLSAIAAAILTPLFAYFYTTEINTIFFAAICLLLLFRHRENIKRLVKGEESKIKFSKKK